MTWHGSDGTHWRDGEHGWFCFMTLGGPFDHHRHKWARMPSGIIPARLFIPVKQPWQFSPKARYEWVGDHLRERDTGMIYYQFVFDGYVDPNNFERLSDATLEIEAMLNLAARAQGAGSSTKAHGERQDGNLADPMRVFSVG
jgi:hypothetical protein